MGSLEAMARGSDDRYLGDIATLKIVEGVAGAIADKGSVLKFILYTTQAVKQGFQEIAASPLYALLIVNMNLFRIVVNLLGLPMCKFVRWQHRSKVEFMDWSLMKRDRFEKQIHYDYKLLLKTGLVSIIYIQ